MFTCVFRENNLIIVGKLRHNQYLPIRADNSVILKVGIKVRPDAADSIKSLS